jgi:Bacterial PH domain/Short C-terminal domain
MEKQLSLGFRRGQSTVATKPGRYVMGIVRSVEWKLVCPADEADARIRQAMTSLGIESQGSPGSIRGAAKRSLRKNRWAAEMSADITPTVGGSIVVCRVDMAGNKHYALLADIADAMGDEVFDDRGVTAAVDRLGKASKLFGRKEIRHLRNLVYGNEGVVELGQGEYEGKQGLLVLTTERLLFFEKSLGRETVEEFPLPSITSMTVSKKLTGERLVVHSSGNQSEIKGMMHGQADALVRAFRDLKQMRQAPQPAPPSAPAPSEDPLTQIERLAQLRDKGLISVEEFEAKKTELMGRL